MVSTDETSKTGKSDLNWLRKSSLHVASFHHLSFSVLIIMVCDFDFFSFKSVTSSLCCGASSSNGMTYTSQTE